MSSSALLKLIELEASAESDEGSVIQKPQPWLGTDFANFWRFANVQLYLKAFYRDSLNFFLASGEILA